MEHKGWILSEQHLFDTSGLARLMNKRRMKVMNLLKACPFKSIQILVSRREKLQSSNLSGPGNIFLVDCSKIGTWQFVVFGQ